MLPTRRKQRFYVSWSIVLFCLCSLMFAWWGRILDGTSSSTFAPPGSSSFLPEGDEGEDLSVSDIPLDKNDVRDAEAESMRIKPYRRLTVCVVSGNPRTASIFYSNLFRRIGNGNFDYQVVTHVQRCSTAQNNMFSPTIRMLFQKSLRMGEVKNLVGKNSLVIVMGDEFCRCSKEFCADPELIFARQYFSTSYPDSFYLPLGPRTEFPLLLDDEDFPFASERSYTYNLIISPTSVGRRELYASLKAKAGDSGDTFVYITPKFQNNASEASGYVSPEQYRAVLLQSKFTLCPAGHNPEAFRIFEAIEVGSIPVVVTGDSEYLNHDCTDAFGAMLGSGAPFVVLKSWDELEEGLAPFLADLEALDERQKAVQQWYGTYWKTLARNFECRFVQHATKLDFPRSGYFYPTECGTTQSGATNLPPPELHTQPSGLHSSPLVTGCGRTGTLSLSEYIVAEMGRKSVHEKMEIDAVSVSWLYGVPDASVYPFEGKKVPKFREQHAALLARANLPLFHPVVHVVRHPLKVISSTRRCFCGRGTRKNGLGRISDAYSWKFVETHVKMPKPGMPLDDLLRSMTYWYEWNSLIRTKHLVSKTLRIEDLDPNELAEGLGISIPGDKVLPSRIPAAEKHVSPEEEKVERPDSTWKDLLEEDEVLARKIFALAKQFGYEEGKATIEDVI